MAHLISVQIAFHGMDLRSHFSNHLDYKGLIALAVAPSEANTRLTFSLQTALFINSQAENFDQSALSKFLGIDQSE